MSVEQNEIVKVIESTGLDMPKARALEDVFSDFYLRAKEWEAKAKTLVVVDASEIDKMAAAREARLAIREVRIGAEKARKAAKEESLKEGKAIDSIGNFIKDLIEPIEDHLDKQEHFVELQEEHRKDELNHYRTTMLAPYVQDLSVYDLREMTDQAFEQLLQGFIASAEAKKKSDKEAQDKIESDRIEATRIKKENDDLKEQNRLKDLEIKQREDAENLRLRQEADRETARLKQIEDDKKAEDDMRRKAESAPDREKLLALATFIESIQLPENLSKHAQSIVDDVHDRLDGIVDDIRQKALII